MSAPLDFVGKWRVTQKWVQASPRLTRSALQVLLRLLDHQNTRTGQCNPSIPTLARATNISDRAARSAVKELIGRGAIEVSKRADSRSNQYRFKSSSQASIAAPPVPLKSTSSRQEGCFQLDRNQPSPKKIKENIKKKEIRGGGMQAGQYPHGSKYQGQPKAPVEASAVEEKRFHAEITAQLEKLGKSYEDLVIADGAIVSGAFADLVSGREPRRVLVKRVVEACITTNNKLGESIE